ncbi:hypothetical protein SMACR_07488 [Sordaria macrospora]|uniref:WGS project CABT00000000 data, contig 2.46 n=2 Tax=Sordaria macrospora TaxID=5147 RepID=F7W8R6_SORMK|nr:uncharacterized protein SMAC_07488 [Sordaria macrospora k-hell]KAA8632551.1 hypothetical protein SMACR_07488 [Sordaria macrospora]WPJ65460.1 hypothetical protein SMAC4_07488 [Sordaria macrospora]CCC13852.1 unnamed protein product [Sordaria macrospora k-hell]
MDNTSNNHVNVPDNHGVTPGMEPAATINSPQVVMEDARNDPPIAPEDRRMTRGMKAAGGVNPLAPTPAQRQTRAREKPVVMKKEEDSDDQDHNPSQGFSKVAALPKKEKSPSADNTDPWACGPNGVPDMDKLVRLLTRDYTKSPEDSDLTEAAHKYKWRGIGPGKHSLWELRSIALSEKASARQEAKENPRDQVARIKLRLCEAIFSHVVGEWEVERYSKWRAYLPKNKIN